MKITTLISSICVAIVILINGNKAEAASASEIDANVNAAMQRFYNEVSGARDLANRAAGILVFPDVVKAGFGIGGEFGEGALRKGGRTQNYYRLVSGSIGFQFGAQVKTEVILFMSEQALNNFRNSDGWEAGVDGSVALIHLGAGGEVDTNTINKPIIGFIISNKGLMYNLSFEGAKISKIDK
jgi:lipid-binding SYLF domain-containing protein